MYSQEAGSLSQVLNSVRKGCRSKNANESLVNLFTILSNFFYLVYMQLLNYVYKKVRLSGILKRHFRLRLKKEPGICNTEILTRGPRPHPDQMNHHVPVR